MVRPALAWIVPGTAWFGGTGTRAGSAAHRGESGRGRETVLAGVLRPEVFVVTTPGRRPDATQTDQSGRHQTTQRSAALAPCHSCPHHQAAAGDPTLPVHYGGTASGSDWPTCAIRAPSSAGGGAVDHCRQ